MIDDGPSADFDDSIDYTDFYRHIEAIRIAIDVQNSTLREINSNLRGIAFVIAVGIGVGIAKAFGVL